MPTAMKIDLQQVPDPFMQALVLANAPEQLILSDGNGTSTLRYLGHVLDPGSPQELEPGIRMRLYFEVLAPLGKEYNFWFHIVDRIGTGEFMLYDWPPGRADNPLACGHYRRGSCLSFTASG